MEIAAFFSRASLAALVLVGVFSVGTSVAVAATSNYGQGGYPGTAANYAQTSNTGSSGGVLQNPLNIGNCGSGTTNAQCLSTFLADILQFVVEIGSIVVILMLVFIGFKFVTAQGAPGKIEQVRNMLLWTIVGALILLGAQAIASGIQATVHALS